MIKINRIKIGIILILLVLGLLFIFHNRIEYWILDSLNSKTSTRSIKQNQSKNNESNYNWGNVSDISSSDLISAKLSNHKINPIGSISIPAIKLSTPIISGVSKTDLLFGAGTMRMDQTLENGNYPLAAHNIHNSKSNNLFTPLFYKAKIHQNVYITNFEKIYKYKISEIEFVNPKRVDVAQNHYDSNNNLNHEITLILCDDTGKGRMVVSADFVASEENNNWINLTKTKKQENELKLAIKSFESSLTNADDYMRNFD